MVDKIDLLYQIKELKQFVADEVDPSYFDDGDEYHLFWLACHYSSYPENYDSDPRDNYKEKK